MWGLTLEFMQTLEDGFKEFFANMGDKDILKAEYLLPIYIDELLQAGRVSVKVLDTNDKWFGVTYKEDKDYVVKSFVRLIEGLDYAVVEHEPLIEVMRFSGTWKDLGTWNTLTEAMDSNNVGEE